MASGYPKKTSTPRLLSRERLTSFTLLPSKFLWDKFLNMKKKASAGMSFLPRIGPCVDLGQTGPKLPSVPPKQNLVQISPPEVVFQHFDPHGVSEMALSLTNVGKVPQEVKVSMESSPYFQLSCSSDVFRLVPPGASAPVRIRFTPGENKDYSHELVCVTENERIVVPIRAIGARAVLDLPARLDLSKCPVRSSTQQTLLVRNVGDQAARYQLSTQRGCVTGPSSHFEVNELDFGDISPGSAYTEASSLSNTSPVSRASLWGEAHSPNLQIQPSTLEFGCLLGGTGEEEKRSLEMANCSSLPVQHHRSVCSSSQGNRLRCEPYPSKFQPQPPKGKRPSLDSSASLRRRFRIRNVEEPPTALRESWDFAQSPGAEVPAQTPEHPQLPAGLAGISSSLDAAHTPLEAEKAFSTVPQSGVLQPGQGQQVSFSFSGPQDTMAGARALCRVQGGPSYEVELIASRASYSLSLQEINCGLQMFNEVGHSRISLENTGRSEFSWVLSPRPADQHLPGVFLVKPSTGFLAPGQKQVLKFSYLPALPGAFSRIYQLQVGDLEPENICLRGEATCPMISVNLPWNIRGGHCLSA
ncbi:uncharacterized protein GJ701_016070 [Geothlypis trichas]